MNIFGIGVTSKGKAKLIGRKKGLKKEQQTTSICFDVWRQDQLKIKTTRREQTVKRKTTRSTQDRYYLENHPNLFFLLPLGVFVLEFVL